MYRAPKIGDPIRPSEIPYRLSMAGDTSVEDARGRFMRGAAAWILEEGWGTVEAFDWERWWRYAPYEVIAGVYSEEELYRLWLGCMVQSVISDHVEVEEHLLWKIENCLWQYGFRSTRQWDSLVLAVDGIRKLALDIEGFDMKLTHTRHTNTHGTSAHDFKLYLDAAFGLIVSYKGEHVLTIGFAVLPDGQVLIAQTQLRQKKGNRFLYKLGRHYLDLVVEMFHRAFGDNNVYLVTGQSAVDAVRRAYGNKPCTMTPEDEVRIAALYDRPLEGFDRVKEDVVEAHWRQYVRLRRRDAASKAA